MLFPWKYKGITSNMKRQRFTLALIEDASLMVHLFFFTLLGVKQYFGTPILCEVSQTNTTPRDKVEAYCWMQGNNQ